MIHRATINVTIGTRGLTCSEEEAAVAAHRETTERLYPGANARVECDETRDGLDPIVELVGGRHAEDDSRRTTAEVRITSRMNQPRMPPAAS